MVTDIFINSGIYILIVIVPLGALILILRGIFGALSRRKKARIVQERMRDINQ